MNEKKQEQTFTDSQTNLLVALSKYRFLTKPHMMKLSIQKNEKALANNVIKPLEKAEKPLISHNENIKVNPVEGKLHYIYSLTEEGAKVVADYLRCKVDDVIFPKRNMRFALDYFHRCDYISFFIAFEQYHEKQDNDYIIEESYHYFDRRRLSVTINGKRYNPTTLLYQSSEKQELDKIEPDGLFITSNFQKKKLYAVEIHRSPNTKEILQQINQHIDTMTQASMSKRFGVKANNYLLSVSSNENTLKHLLARIQLLPAIDSFKDYIVFLV